MSAAEIGEIGPRLMRNVGSNSPACSHVRTTPRITRGPARRGACASCKRRDGADRRIDAVVRQPASRVFANRAHDLAETLHVLRLWIEDEHTIAVPTRTNLHGARHDQPPSAAPTTRP